MSLYFVHFDHRVPHTYFCVSQLEGYYSLQNDQKFSETSGKGEQPWQLYEI
jgi:hypothetical protein